MRELEDLALRHGFGSAEYQRAVESLLELWEEFSFLDPADPALPLDLRLAAGDCARLVADFGGLGRLPTDWTRLTILQRARAWLPHDLPQYPRDIRAYLELDYIEEVAAAGDIEGALQLAARAHEDFQDVPQALVEAHVMEANHWMHLGRYDRALSSIESARRRLVDLEHDQTPRAFVPIWANVVEGLILISLGLPDRAVRLKGDCEAAFSRGDSPESEGLMITLATQLALARDDYSWIVETLPPRLETGGFRGDSPEMVAGRWLDVAVARAYSALQRHENLESARADLLALLGTRPLTDVTLMDGPLVLAELEHALGDHGAALERVERLESELDGILSPGARLPRQRIAELKGRILLTTTPRTEDLERVHAELETGFRDLLNAWESAPQREGGVGFLLFDSRSSMLATLIRVTTALRPGRDGIERALQYVLEADARSTLVRRVGAPTASVAEVLEELVPADGGILHYVPSPSGSILFVLTPQDLRVYETASARNLREWTSGWCASWIEPDETSPSEPPDAALELLEGLLPGELQSEILRWTSLTIVGVEALNFVPFEALTPSAADGIPLGRSHSISYLPGLSMGLYLARRAPLVNTANEGPLVQLVVGVDEVTDESGRTLPALPWREQDLETLRGAWDRERIDVVTESSQARTATLLAGSRGILALQIVAHGVREGSRERAFGFDFGAGSPLFPEDLADKPTPPLVALAVCGAGRGVARVGDEGASHLGGAFLASGTRAVLMSRHDLSYEASIALLGAFNRALARGEPAAGAMRTARNEIARDPRWAHPRFHALLHVYGDGSLHAPDLVRATSSACAWWWAALAGAVVLAAWSSRTMQRRRQVRRSDI